MKNEEHNMDEKEDEGDNEQEQEQYKASPKLQAKINECLERFYQVMNDCAKDLNMKKSNFASAHGMYVEKNVSSAADIAKLCHHTMKIQRFKEIVKVSDHELVSLEFPEHTYKWQNTNFLLKREPNCTGIKTGITWAAGPCLAASMKKDNYHICVVVLSCCSMDSRWYEVPKLVHWGVKKL